MQIEPDIIFLSDEITHYYPSLPCSPSACLAQNDHYLLVGTYTEKKSEGIYVYRFNSDSGSFKAVSVAKTSNPSYLAVSPDQRYVYAVNENADSTRYTVTGSVAAFSIDKKTGVLSPINKQESGGKHPCYVSVDKTGKWVVAGNYSSGSLALLKVQPDGGLSRCAAGDSA